MLMKKYVKPELFFESFELSQQIASCDFDSKGSLMDVENCEFSGTMPNTNIELNIFMSGSSCRDDGNAFCYYGSTGDILNIFNS